MQKKLRRQFVWFNLLAMTCVLTLLTLGVLLSSRSRISISRLVVALVICIVLVYIFSIILSRIALAPIQKAWQKQLDFTADASHELRTPLAVMRINLEIVLDNLSATVESQKEWIDNINSENKRMTKLVEDLLTLSRADTDSQVLEQQTFCLDEAIMEAVIPFEPIASSHNIALNLDLQSQVLIHGDKKRMQQLVVILVDNAIKYMNRSGLINVVLHSNDKFIEIYVSDTGIGIASDDLKKIFDRFYRVTKAYTKDNDGSGLGLAIAKWIVEAHRGTIRAESTVGVGTKFTIHLPH